jgi:hypothetical protein
VGGRSKAPPWVRWAGQDLVALGMGLRQEVDALLVGLVMGAPLDETIRRVQGLRELADEAVARGKDLQHAPADGQLVDWAMRDENFLAVLVARMEGR